MRFLFGVLGLFLFNHSFAQEPQITYEMLQSIAQMEQEFDEHSIGYLHLAMDTVFVQPEKAEQALSEFVRRNDKILRDEGLLPFDGISPDELLPYAVEINPEIVRHLNLGLLEGVINSLTKISQDVRETKLDTGDNIRRWSLRGQYMKAEESALRSLQRLKRYLTEAPPAANQAFWQKRSQLLYLHSRLVEAMTRLWPTAVEWSQEIHQSVDRFVVSKGVEREFFRESQVSQRLALHAIMNREKGTEIFRVWVNGENATVAALSALLIVEGACTIMTAGFCAGTIPATAGLLARTGQVVTTGARVVLASQAALNLVDRYRFDGAIGLLNVQSLVDVLLLVSLLPTPSLKALSAQNIVRIWGHEIRLQTAALSLARFQQSSSKALLGIAGGYGVYQLTFAEKIAAQLADQGLNITVSEVRAQGAVNVVMGLLGGLKAYQNHQATLKGSPEYRAYLERLAAENKGLRGALERLSPTSSMGNVIRGVWRTGQAFLGNGKPLLENIKFAGYPIAKGTLLSGYQFLAYGTYTMMAFTYSNYSFRNQSRELPDLKDGEIALILNGFSTNDLLYHGFTTTYANRFEIEKYRGSGKIYYGFFKSPRELFEQIESYGKRYGKVRYVKVLGHGIPGKLVPDANNITGEGEELVDREYIESHDTFIRQVGTQHMAPDAQITFVSCLLGGNMERDVVYKNIPIEKDAGDQFLKALGDRLLPRGGTIDSSRRIILAAEGTMVPLFESTTTHGHPAEQKYQAFAQLDQIRNQYADLFEKPNLEMESAGGEIIHKEKADAGQLVASTGKRFISMMKKIWEVAYTFGVELEGGFFHEKHHRMEFATQPAGSSGD